MEHKTTMHKQSLRSLCVFCGSSPGADPAYLAAAHHLGATLATNGMTLVYGGASVGLMGAMADAALAAGGRVIGVLPQALQEREVGHAGLSELHIVGSMHERKARMADLADGFVALPGGAGTLEEFFEVWTWGMLGLHTKPCALLNTNGYFDPLLAMFDRMVEQRFVRPIHRAMVIVASDPVKVIERCAAYQPPTVAKWIDRGET